MSASVPQDTTGAKKIQMEICAITMKSQNCRNESIRRTRRTGKSRPDICQEVLKN